MRSIDETGFGLKVRDWNSDELLVRWLEQWAHQANAQLAEAGEEARIDHRTLVAQREEAMAQASAEPHGERRDALDVRAAAMDREPSPYLRASWYMEQKTRASAQAAGLAYEPVTDRGAGWWRCGRSRPSGWRRCGYSRRIWRSRRLPGLSDPLAAYEAGRALRMIGYIFDEQGSSVSASGAFVPQVADVVLFFALRGERQPFGAADMAFVFLDICTPADAPREMREQTEAAILQYARQRPTIARRMN